jgi:hypothetical protein
VDFQEIADYEVIHQLGAGHGWRPQQTRSHFTVRGMPQRATGFVDSCTMLGWSRAKVRRYEHAAAVVCALSLFVALVAGSALRPHYTTNALPEPGAWTHPGEHVQHYSQQLQPISAAPSLSAQQARSGSPPMPISRKPFRYVWMTHDLPSSWVPLLPQLDWSALPKSFISAQFQARGAPWAEFGRDPDHRFTATLFSIIRC